MGLDGVELILKIEDRFQITLEDDAIGRVSTMSQLHALVLSKVDHSLPMSCATSRAFYSLRVVLMSSLGLERKAIRPETRLDEIFDSIPRQRRQQWAQFQGAARLKIPDLERSWHWSLLASTVGAGLSLLIATRLGSGWTTALVTTIVGMVVGGSVLASTPLGVRHFPFSSKTVGDLTRTLLGRNVTALQAPSKRWTDDDVWLALKQIVVEQTGVPEAQVVRAARIVEDLGIDQLEICYRR